MAGTRAGCGIIVIAVVACGRIGFDTTGGDGGGGDDQPVDASPGLLDATPMIVGTTTISTAAALANCPSIAWDGTGWGVAWRDRRNANVGEIYFARVDAAGAITHAEKRMTTQPAETLCPDLAWTGVGQRYAVAYPDDRLGDYEIFVQVFEAGMTGVERQVTDDTGQSTLPALAWSAQPVVAWRDVVGGTAQTVRVIGIDPTTGAPVGTSALVSATGANVTHPDALAVAGATLVAYYDDSSSATLLATARLAPTVHGAPAPMAAVGSASVGAPVFAAPNATTAAAIWIGPTGSDLWFGLVDPDTAAIRGARASVAGPQSTPAMAWFGGAYGIVSMPALRFALHGPDGGRIGADTALGSPSGKEPALATGDAGFGAAWIHSDDTVLFARITI